MTMLDLVLGGVPMPEGTYGLCYLRVSDDDQTSIPEQLQIARTAAARFGIIIPDSAVFIDKGESRSLFLKREGLQRMLRASSDPRATHLFVWITSRLYGSPEQMLEIYTQLRRNKVLLYDGASHPGMPPINGGSHTDKLIGLVKSWQSEAEVIELRERVRSTHQVKAENGRLISRPPYGVAVVKAHTLPCAGVHCVDDGRGCSIPHSEVGKKNETVWIIDEQQRAVLLRIYHWIAEGVTTGEVCRRLQAAGVRSPEREVQRGRNQGRTHGGVFFNKNNLRKMVINPFYKGEVIWGQYRTERDGDEKRRVPTPESEWTRTLHSLGPLIDPALWAEAVRQIQSRHKTRDEARTYEPMLFDGLVYCGRCGWKMYPRRRAKKKADGSDSQTFDYLCMGVYNNYSSCKRAHIIPTSWLPMLLAGQIIGPAAGRTAPDIEVSYEQAKVDNSAAELAALQAQVVDVDSRMKNLAKLAEGGFYTVETALERKAALEQERDMALARQAELLAAPVGDSSSGRVPEELSVLMDLLLDEELPLQERRLSLGRVLDRVIVDRPSTVRFVLRPAESLEA